MKRWTKWSVGIFLALATTLFCVNFFSDIDPIDDSDLRFDEPIVRDERNGALLLLRALRDPIAPTQLPNLPRTVDLRPTFGERSEGIETSHEIAIRRPAVEQNALVIAAIERAVEAEVFSFTGFSIEERLRLGALDEPFIEEAALIAWADGDAWRARELLELLRVLHARSIRRHPGAAFQQSFNRSIRDHVPRHLVDLAAGASLTAEQMRSWLAEPGITAYPEGWAETYFRQGYVMAVQDLRNGEFVPAGGPRFLRLERTVEELSRRTRKLMVIWDSPAIHDSVRVGTIRRLGQLLGGNATGTRYAREWRIDAHFLTEQYAAEQERRMLTAIRTLLALRLHRRTHDAWPEPPDDLDPAIWPADLAPPLFIALDEAFIPIGAVDLGDRMGFDPTNGRWRAGKIGRGAIVDEGDEARDGEE